MANSYCQAIETLLQETGVKINGTDPWDLQVHDERFFQRVFREGEMGLGESYMDGWWDAEAVDQMIDRVLSHQVQKRIRKDGRVWWLAIKSRLFNRQNRHRAFIIGQKHYDRGNDLYVAMLDKRLNYTCAYWHNADDLDSAQEAKLDLVCRKIGLEPGMTVLDLGCGWGAFAKFAAEKYGARVLGVTVSKEQVELGTQMCKGLPVELRLLDYRQVDGQFDRVISIGIMEHVGYKNYRTYFRQVDRCLKPGGLAFVHTIGTDVSTVTTSNWIEKYIFPNGQLPSLRQLTTAMEGLFVVEDLHNIGPHYDPTLMAWYQNFLQAWPKLRRRYDERFFRMWSYYLLSSAGGFRSRYAQVWQIVLTRQNQKQPDCRFS
ncbi:MAG TPA: cyclopropane fatty acyl phospholipid synthase [bacterium]|nr:cyclopropane fatty acyl phospholipid synthase [bacterium]HPG46236.1 cyclopropane fatty acyl phospholipid synthase [bacterium]HPM98570.1 cyclopropane fatty acyl phospholipid synthase [bacterium]